MPGAYGNRCSRDRIGTLDHRNNPDPETESPARSLMIRNIRNAMLHALSRIKYRKTGFVCNFFKAQHPSFDFFLIFVRNPSGRCFLSPLSNRPEKIPVSPETDKKGHFSPCHSSPLEIKPYVMKRPVFRCGFRNPLSETQSRGAFAGLRTVVFLSIPFPTCGQIRPKRACPFAGKPPGKR